MGSLFDNIDNFKGGDVCRRGLAEQIQVNINKYQDKVFEKSDAIIHEKMERHRSWLL